MGTVLPVGNTTITYVATDVTGNTSLCEFIITRYPLPDASAGLDSVVCFGESASLGGINTGSGGVGTNYHYIWYPVAMLDNPTLANPTSVPLTTTTTFFVQVYDDSTHCVGTDISTVVVTDPTSGVVVNHHQKISLDSGGIASNEFDLNDRF